jgi:hypothetical protein
VPENYLRVFVVASTSVNAAAQADDKVFVDVQGYTVCVLWAIVGVKIVIVRAGRNRRPEI